MQKCPPVITSKHALTRQKLIPIPYPLNKNKATPSTQTQMRREVTHGEKSGLGHPTAKVANDHLGLVRDGIDVISPPLQHSLAFWQVFGPVVCAPDCVAFAAGK